MTMDDDDDTPQVRPRKQVRAISRTDAEALAAVYVEAIEESKAHDSIEGIHRLLAEYFGKNGDGGRFEALEDKMKEQAVIVSELRDFKHRATWTFGLLSALGGVIAGLALLLVEHWLK